VNEQSAYLIDKRALRHSLERATESYDSAAVLSREVFGRMFERLQYFRVTPEVILDAGCATGHGADKLHKRFPGSSIILLEIAYPMLRSASARTSGWLGRFSPLRGAPRWLVCADLERLPLKQGSVGMIWSNLALHWYDPQQAIREAHRVLRPGGLLLFSTLGPDTLKELRAAFRGLDSYTHVHRFMDMHDVGDVLTYNGFADPVMDMEVITLTYADALALMHDLRKLGSRNVTLGRRRGLMGKSAWRRVLQRCEMFRVNDRLPAAFEIVYGHAWKGTARAPAPGSATRVIDVKRLNRRS
jgi:malonyl-CoA O-methyltransferase